MDGIDATKKIRHIMSKEFKQLRKDQPKIIGITGHVENNFKQEGLKAGMDEILAKPVYINVFKETLIKYVLLKPKQ